jgi:hypothetical protein
MKKWALSAVVALSLLLVGVASAAPPQRSTLSFDMPFGSICNRDGCVSASADFSGTLSGNDLSNLAGTLELGPSPFAKGDRRLSVRPHNTIHSFQGGFGDVEACLRGETGVWEWTHREEYNQVEVSIRSSSLNGTGNLNWGTHRYCVKTMDWMGNEVIESGGGDFAHLGSTVVSPHDAGHLFLHGTATIAP